MQFCEVTMFKLWKLTVQELVNQHRRTTSHQHQVHFQAAGALRQSILRLLYDLPKCAKLHGTFLQLGWIITSNAGNKMRNAIAAMISAFKWSHQYHHTGNITPALSQGHHYNNTQYTKINHLSVAINSLKHSHSH